MRYLLLLPFGVAGCVAPAEDPPRPTLASAARFPSGVAPAREASLRTHLGARLADPTTQCLAIRGAPAGAGGAVAWHVALDTTPVAQPASGHASVESRTPVTHQLWVRSVLAGLYPGPEAWVPWGRRRWSRWAGDSLEASFDNVGGGWVVQLGRPGADTKRHGTASFWSDTGFGPPPVPVHAVPLPCARFGA